jgi:hypothetical protein
MQPRLTDGAVDWDGFGDQLVQATNALLGGPAAVLLIDESVNAQEGRALGRARSTME